MQDFQHMRSPGSSFLRRYLLNSLGSRRSRQQNSNIGDLLDLACLPQEALTSEISRRRWGSGDLVTDRSFGEARAVGDG
eukprot:1858107-Pyramimonas_sp.AAC.2